MNERTQPHLRHIRYSHKAGTWQVQDKHDRTKWRAIRPALMYAYRAVGFKEAAAESLAGGVTHLRFSHRFNSWQACVGGTWVNVNAVAARGFYDEGLSIGCQS